QKLVRQVRGALVYPSVVVVIAAGVMTVLLTFVIPAFENMFADFGGGKEVLPKLTQIMVAISHGFVIYLPFIVLGTLLFAIGIVYTYRNPAGKRFLHDWTLRLPVIGPVM